MLEDVPQGDPKRTRGQMVLEHMIARFTVEVKNRQEVEYFIKMRRIIAQLIVHLKP